MILLYQSPSMVDDLDAWKRHLEWLRTEPEEIVARADAIEFATTMVDVLENDTPPQRPTEAA